MKIVLRTGAILLNMQSMAKIWSVKIAKEAKFPYQKVKFEIGNLRSLNTDISPWGR